jgi:hypothetical protein
MMLTTINFGKICLHNETIADDSSESSGVHEHSFLIQRKSYFIIPFLDFDHRSIYGRLLTFSIVGIHSLMP